MVQFVLSEKEKLCLWSTNRGQAP